MLVCVLVEGPLCADPLNDRIAQSAAAAQALQGPFDGAWTLRNHAGRVLFALQMSDPPDRQGPVEGAWRNDTGAIGPATFFALTGPRLRLVIQGAAPADVVLTRRGAGVWRGVFPGHGLVTLTRGLATPGPPV